MKVKVIGIGGIGGFVLPVLTRYLAYSYPNAELTLIDGDSFEDRNAERQSFTKIGNKAEVVAERLEVEFPELLIISESEFITEDNAVMFIRENDIVFLCVDNHATRKLVSERCGELNTVCVISGGNDYTTGNIQVFVRKDGDNVTLPLANEFHPEIQYPEDRNPGEVGCDAQVKHEPQLLIMNNSIASRMVNAFYGFLQGHAADYDEAYDDIVRNSVRPVNRR